MVSMRSEKKLDECVDVFGLNKESVDVFALYCVTAFYHYSYFISPWYTYLYTYNYLFYIAPQQQLYELLALYRSTNALEHTSICYLN